MVISVTLVHNKTDAENAAQVTALANLLTLVNDDTGYYHTVTLAGETHEIRVFQIVPFGVTPPANIYSINSGGIVYYGEGDNDKIGSHPRFFNWGLKRGTDRGASVSIYISDPSVLTGTKLRQSLGKLINDTELVEEPWGKLATLRLLKQVGQLKEDRDFTSAITDLKQRVVEKGLNNG